MICICRDSVSRESPNEKKHIPVGRWEFDEYHGAEPGSDGTFAYIAGYTSSDVPYGVTSEEMEEQESCKQAQRLSDRRRAVRRRGERSQAPFYTHCDGLA